MLLLPIRLGKHFFGNIFEKGNQFFPKMVEETPKPPEFSVEGYKAMMGMALGDDEEKNKIAAEIAEKCKSLTHEDHCEMAFLLAKCMADEAEARGLKKA